MGRERQTEGRTEVRLTCVVATSMGFLPFFCRYQTRDIRDSVGSGGRKREWVRSKKPQEKKNEKVTVAVTATADVR